MRFIGVLATLFIGGVTALGAVLAVRSIPDIKRYLAMRRM